MARKIVMTSGKGGVGKTTVCANLGINLAKLGFRVVIIDVDIGLNNIDVVMGIENQIVFGGCSDGKMSRKTSACSGQKYFFVVFSSFLQKCKSIADSSRTCKKCFKYARKQF